MSVTCSAPALAAASSFWVNSVCERAQPRFIALSCGLLGRRQLGARMDELLVIDVEQLGLFGIEVELRLVVVELLEALEQLGVEIDEIVCCAANSGEVLVSVACSVSLVFAPLTAWKARLARSSSSPDLSIATTVLSKVGVAFWLAIAATSRFCWAIPASSAGR